MADPRLAELRAEIEHSRRRLEAVVDKLARARRETIPTIGRTDDSALIVAGYLETLDAAHPVALTDMRSFQAFVEALDRAAGR